MTLKQFFIANAFNILAMVSTTIVFVGGAMSWWGGFKQKQRYNDTVIANMMERLIKVESLEHCDKMHQRCEEERNAEMLEVARQLGDMRNDRKAEYALISNQISTVRDNANANFKLLFAAQEEIKIFMARVDEKLIAAEKSWRS